MSDEGFYEAARAVRSGERFGHRHHSALRALAHKWLKIILAMRRTGTLYDETVLANRRCHQLSQTRSP